MYIRCVNIRALADRTRRVGSATNHQYPRRWSEADDRGDIYIEFSRVYMKIGIHGYKPVRVAERPITPSLLEVRNSLNCQRAFRSYLAMQG